MEQLREAVGREKPAVIVLLEDAVLDRPRSRRSVNKQEVRSRIEEVGIIPAIRVSSVEDALFAAEAVSRGGIPIVEVTLTVPEGAYSDLTCGKAGSGT